MSLLVSAVISASMGAGCMSARIREEKKQEVEDVGIFVLLNPRLSLKYVEVRKNAVRWADVSHWNAATLMAVEMTSSLQHAGKRVVPFKLDSHETEKVIRKGNTALNRQTGNIYGDLRTYLIENAASQGIRYIWFVKPVRDANKTSAPGMSMICRRSGSDTSRWELYLQVSAELINVTTGENVVRASITGDKLSRQSSEDCRSSERLGGKQVAAFFRHEFQGMARAAAPLILQETGFVLKP